jgi:hypothetical protein
MVTLVLVVIWVLFSIESAIRARACGRRARSWFWMGLLFGPIAFLVILTIPTPEERQYGSPP